MKIVIAGGTGFIGRALSERLLKEQHELILLTRNVEAKTSHPPRLRYVAWDLFRVGGGWEKELDGADAIINLTGESIAGKRWSPQQKKELLNSRLLSIKAIHRALQKAKSKPAVLVNASAIGYYGDRRDEELDENSSLGTGFLADLCKQWEDEIRACEEDLHLRTVRLRIGIVLEKGGGALGRMLLPFSLGLGGPLGNGRQWMSWIHREDLLNLICLALSDVRMKGAVNATAPNPVTMREFAQTLGRSLRRPALFPVPGILLRILIGEMADMLLGGQKVLPRRALDLGYSFSFETLEQALADILSRRDSDTAASMEALAQVS